MSSTRSSSPAPSHASDAGSARQRAVRVLVIDDDDEGLSRVSDLLEAAGFVALCQSSPFGAAELAARAGVAAAVIDVKTSLQHDSQLIRGFRRRAELRELPIILVSSGATERVDPSKLSFVVMLAKASMPLTLVPLLRSLVS